MRFLRSTSKKNAAFTLIELLVVIAIISLLVSILLPSLKRAKELAVVVQCQSRLHHIGSALMMYTSDFDRGCIGFTYGPSGWDNPFGTAPHGEYKAFAGWYSNHDYALKPYLSDTSPKGKSTPDRITHCPTAPAGNSTGYALNAAKGYEMYLGDRVDLPATTPMLSCPICHSGDGVEDFEYLMYPSNWQWMSTGDRFYSLATESNHKGTNSCNFLFFDGHAENQSALGSLQEYRDMWTWAGR